MSMGFSVSMSEVVCCQTRLFETSFDVRIRAHFTIGVSI
jgi:hypothetical protein